MEFNTYNIFGDDPTSLTYLLQGASYIIFLNGGKDSLAILNKHGKGTFCSLLLTTPVKFVFRGEYSSYLFVVNAAVISGHNNL